MDKTKAEEFFRQLGVFSAAYLKTLGLPSQSPWGREVYDGAGRAPKGAILHYTADMKLDSSLRWFCTEKFNARASSHVVVAPKRIESAGKLLSGLPLVAELPVTVVQVRPPRTMAWHATWTNGFMYGIENSNAGELRKEAGTGRLMHWPPKGPGAPEWTTPWVDSSKKHPIDMAGRTWDNYPPDQVWANVLILRYVNALFGGSLQAPWILGHEQVQGKETLTAAGTPMKTQKRDPGPTFPLSDIRRSALSGNDTEQWVQDYTANPRCCESERDRVVVKIMGSLAGGQIHSPETAWVVFNSELRVLPERAEFGVIGKLALWLLGFYVTKLETSGLSPEDEQGVRIFQKLMGLQTDGKPGKLTKEALVRRLVDRGFLPES